MESGETERERLARVGYVAMMECYKRQQGKPDALVAPWEMVSPNTQDGMMAFADAVAAALLNFPDRVASGDA